MRSHQTFFASLLCLLLCLGPGRAQSPAPTSVELDLDTRARIAAIGASGVKLHTSALRVTTGLAPGLRFEVYGTHKYGSYSVQESYVEKDGGMNRLQAGLVRLPFGIYDFRETYASGLIDYPMARGNYGYNSVDWGVPGVSWASGSDRLQIEAAAFGGKATGVWDNQNRVSGGAVRAQTYVGNLILGVSRWDGSLYPAPTATSGQPVHLNGVDVRYTRSHWLLRGECLFGELAGDKDWGWYLDAYYRLPRYEKWTLTGRVEAYRPGSDYALEQQVTLGARYVVSREWTLALNWRHNNPGAAAGTTWTPYAGKGGDVFFQAYRKFNY